MSFTNEPISSYFQELSGPKFTEIVFYLLPEKEKFSLELEIFPLNTSTEDIRPVLQILAKFLGRKDVMVVDNSILGMFSLMMKPRVILDIPTYLENVINNQFSHANIEEICKSMHRSLPSF